MEGIISGVNTALSFAYDNILSIAMMVLLIAAGVFLSVRTGFFQFRRFGYVLKNTVGKLFNKSLHCQDSGSVSPFQAVTTALAGTISEYLVTIPKSALTHIQNTAPGPPSTSAVATPAMLPVPMVPARAVVTAWKGLTLPLSLWCSFLSNRLPTVFFIT